MNYETYKELTDEQKDEYDWRFREEPPVLSFSFSNIIVLYVLSVMMIFLTYTLIKNPDLGVTKLTALSLLNLSGSILRIIVYFLLFEQIVNLIKYIKFQYDYRKWKRLEGIK